MLYSKNTKKELPHELFKNPTSEYRGAPFWAWNNKLDKDLLLREIDQMKEMGVGGFHIHCRSGLETEYLGDEYMSLVADCNEKAKSNEMLCWLYDEDRWPSGAAGGIVTKDHRYRARYLVFEPLDLSSYEEDVDLLSCVRQGNNRKFLAAFEVELNNGFLNSYRRLSNDSKLKKPGGKDIWTASLEINGDNPWFNNEAYVNTLDKKAIEKFIEVTHEKYFSKIGTDFGKSVPAIFTDEPQFTHKDCLNFAEDKRAVVLPYTDDFDETYRATYGDSILDCLPELFWELPDGKVSQARYRYHDHLSERFASAFADTIGKWCKEHGIMLTGHMMEEDSLWSQTRALGDCMRSYRSFDLPGIDNLCDERLFSTAKQAASAAHQYGRPGVLSELYGVTNWDFDFRGHKLAGDWQAALGITVRVHHLNWVSMEGEAKRDYPAPIGYQSTWYKEYPMIENHFSRLNTALTRGKPHVRVAVIHPVETYWLHWGPKEQTQLIRDELDNNFKNLTNWLLYGFIDFDFISESLLPSQAAPEQGSNFSVGEMQYEAVLVPGCETLRSTTLERLMSFKRAGGRVIFAGEPPKFIDAAESDEIMVFAKECENISFSRVAILEALDNHRDIDIRSDSGARAGNLLYQMRQDGDKRWLFICHANKPWNAELTGVENIYIRIGGSWKPTIYDTMTGNIYECPSSVKNNMTVIPYSFYAHDSVLLQLEPIDGGTVCDKERDFSRINALPDRNNMKSSNLPQPSEIILSEPNVLVLDMAEYSFDDGEWNSEEEILRIDNLFRRKIDFPRRDETLAQPWTISNEDKPEHILSLRYTIHSDIDVTGAHLAMEKPTDKEIFVNGVQIDTKPDSWFTDECIQCVPIPTLKTGKNVIIIRIPFAKRTNVEWCYLLGNFGVAAAGRFAKIIPPGKTIAFGDWTTQGLPFYAGNVTYVCDFECEKSGRVLIEMPHYKASLLSVSVDGGNKQNIAFAPYIADLGVLEKGKHSVAITAFGNRINAFGPLHCSDTTLGWFGPNSWRTSGNAWSYEYRLKQSGILVTPIIWME